MDTIKKYRAVFRIAWSLAFGPPMSDQELLARVNEGRAVLGREPITGWIPRPRKIPW